jgi:hypothetical protein
VTDELLRELITAMNALTKELANSNRPVVKLNEAAKDWSISTPTLKKIAAILAEDGQPISFAVEGNPLFSRRAMAAVEARFCNLPEPQRNVR